MDKKTFLNKMMVLLDLEEEPKMEDFLADFDEWDSLAYVSFLSMANKVSTNRVYPDKVHAAETVADLFALIKVD